MRTIINLDDDVLETAKMLAVRERKPLGKVISGLLRRAVEPAAQVTVQRNGMTLFPVASGARTVTPQIIKELRDEVS